MEKEQEIIKLVNVLRKTSRMAQQSSWSGSEDDTRAYTVSQYNKVLKRLIELDDSVRTVFQPLEDTESLSVVAMACRQLAAYFEDEIKHSGSPWGKIYGAAFDTESFKDFWKESAKEIEDLGEFIRENIETWANQRKSGNTEPTGAASDKSDG
ncbi:MAG: hypothetical protein AB8G77_12930 [Rhodothermales bacterium]